MKGLNAIQKIESSTLKLTLTLAAITISMTACLAPDKPAPSYKPTNEPISNAGTSPQKSYWVSKTDETEPTDNSQIDKSGATALGEQQHQNHVHDRISSALWQPASPLLKGIAIGDSMTDIHLIYGEELSVYSLTEENETIKVLEYDGFSIGLNEQNTVHFVEIYGKKLPTGLSGIQIGDHPEQAVKELGKPEKQTDYLLTFTAVGALHKLDIDPAQNEIISIKLMSTTS